MTVMEAKAELREYIRLSEIIKEKQAYVARISLQFEGMEFLTNSKKMPRTFMAEKKIVTEKYNELIKRQNDFITRAEQAKCLIESKLEKLDKTSRKILHMKYIKGLTLILISTLLNYEYTWLCKLHAKALSDYSRL